MRISDYVADDGAGNLAVPSQSTVPATISAMNIDDVFLFLVKNGVTELEASFEEMFMIATFVLANTNSPEMHKEYSKIFTDGQISRFMGVNLKFVT